MWRSTDNDAGKHPEPEKLIAYFSESGTPKFVGLCSAEQSEHSPIRPCFWSFQIFNNMSTELQHQAVTGAADRQCPI